MRRKPQRPWITRTLCTIYEINGADGPSSPHGPCDLPESQTKVESGPVDLDEGWDIAIQVADGLAEARQSEIVPSPPTECSTKRVKPQNHEFRLAKLSGRTKLTKTSTTISTVAYMSSKHGFGKEVDYRSDLF